MLPWKKIADNTFNLNRTGLNHLAFGVKNVKELTAMQHLLDKHKIKNKGIRNDKYENNPYIWFQDDDGIGLEFYLRK